MKEQAIEFINVSKSFERGAVQAVVDLSLSVGRGEVFGLIGPNGAGKTTSLKLLAGILKPDKGEIRCLGVSSAREPLRVRGMTGYAGAEPLLYERMTGFQFLGFIARMYRIDRKEALRRIDELAGRFSLREQLPEQIASYPYGVKQKLSLTAVFLHEPDVVILDEPFNGLDPMALSALIESLKTLVRAHATVFLSSYLMDLVEKVCTRVGVLRRGTLLAADKIFRLKRQGGVRRATLEEAFVELVK